MKIIKKLAAAAIAAASLAVATPAFAGTYIIFLDEYYNPVGYRLYCGGQVVSSGGIETGYVTWFDYPGCY